MTRRHVILAAAVIVVCGGVPAFTHEYFRVIGTITKYEKSILSVKDQNSKTTLIQVNRQTQVVRDKKKVETSELAVGLSVVVDAYGDSEEDLLALDVRIVPLMGSKKK